MGENVATRVVSFPTEGTIVVDRKERVNNLFQELVDLSENYKGTSTNVSIEIKPISFRKRQSKISYTVVVKRTFEDGRGTPVDLPKHANEVKSVLEQYGDVIDLDKLDVKTICPDVGKDCIEFTFNVKQ